MGLTQWFSYAILYLLHLWYRIYIKLEWFRRPVRDPLPLDGKRPKMPKHLGVLLKGIDQSNEKECAENVQRLMGWCQDAGIETLSVYDEQGFIQRQNHIIRESLSYPVRETAKQECKDCSDSEIEYPLTPPLSEHSGSRPLSPVQGSDVVLTRDELCVVTLSNRAASLVVKEPPQKAPKGVRRRRNSKPAASSVTLEEPINPLTVNLLSRNSAKPALVALTRALARTHRHHSSQEKDHIIDVPGVTRLLEGEYGFTGPDLMIVHSLTNSNAPLELDGFPPWQLRLTELYHTKFHRSSSVSDLQPLDEIDVRNALDEFASAEMRLGR
jgi:dehydrodolichyl diphosphate syntase complex subunit NUS1